MNKPRSLRLASERLGDLSVAELSAVAGGTITTPTAHITCRLDDVTAALAPDISRIPTVYTC